MLTVLLASCLFLPQAQSSTSLGKMLFGTITEPKPAQTINIDVYKDEIFQIKGIAQRLSAVNLYIYSRIPQKIRDFAATVSDTAATFTWTPRDIFTYHPEQSNTQAPPGSYQYTQYIGNVPDATLAIKNTAETQTLREDKISGKVVLTCDRDRNVHADTVVFDLDFRRSRSDRPGIFDNPSNPVVSSAAATNLCNQLDSNGNFKSDFSIDPFSFPVWNGFLSGSFTVQGGNIMQALSRWNIKQPTGTTPGEELSGIHSPEGCEWVIYTAEQQNLSYFSGSVVPPIGQALKTTIHINALAATENPACPEVKTGGSKPLMGSIPILWSKNLTNNAANTAGAAVSCENYKDELAPELQVNCRKLNPTEYGNPYKHYDHLLGYRDSLPAPGNITPAQDTTIPNSMYMQDCKKTIDLIDMDNPPVNVNDNGNIIINFPPAGCGPEVKCDYSGCRDSLCSTTTQSCTPPALLNCSGEGVLRTINGCETVDNIPGTGWLTTSISAANHADLDIPGISGNYTDLAPQNENQTEVQAGQFSSKFNPVDPTSVIYHKPGYNLFVYATQTQELACTGGECGYDIVQDGAANSFSNYPIRDYVTLLDGFQQYEIYAVPEEQYAVNEGVTREKGVLVATVKDPSANTVTAPIPAALQGKKLHFAIFEVREGPETNRGFKDSRVPLSLTKSYTDQGGKIGHLLTSINEVEYTPGNPTVSTTPADKFEWEVFAEDGHYDEVKLRPIKTDKDEHFIVQGTTNYDSKDGKTGLDKYVLNRFADTHYIVATYLSTDTAFQADNPATFFLKASREALNFLSVKQTGSLGTIGVQNYNTYGVVYDAWTKNLLPNVLLQIDQVGSTRKYQQYTTTSNEGIYTFSPFSSGTYQITPVKVNGLEHDFIFPVNAILPTQCTSGKDGLYQDLYCRLATLTLQQDTTLHRDIPLAPSVAGTLTGVSDLLRRNFVVYLNGGGQTAVNPDGKFSFFLAVGSYTVSKVVEYDSKGKVLKEYTPGGSVAVTNMASSPLNISL